MIEFLKKSLKEFLGKFEREIFSNENKNFIYFTYVYIKVAALLSCVIFHSNNLNGCYTDVSMIVSNFSMLKYVYNTYFKICCVTYFKVIYSRILMSCILSLRLSLSYLF